MSDSTDSSELRLLPTFFRPSDLARVGFTRYQLRSLMRAGLVERVARGVYRRTDVPVTEMETILLVASQVPGGIVCLLSALRIHGIGTQSPPEVWMAIPHKARSPRVGPWSVRFVRWSGASLTHGVQGRSHGGVTYRITSPARTIVDCFRYRNKIGLDVALEALKDGLRSRKATVADIDRAAQACRAARVMSPYLEAVLS